MQCRRPRFDSWVRKIPGEGNDNLLQCSCLENPMDREAWQATIHGVTRVRHNLATKPTIVFLKVHSKEIIFYKYYQFAYFVIVVQSLNCFWLFCNPMDYKPSDFPGKNCHFLLQGIFPTQGSTPHLLHHRQILLPLSHQGSYFTSF